jgi:hypothetical protein
LFTGYLKKSSFLCHRDFGDYNNSAAIDNFSYPFFYYQLPELVPNLVIALGISPPNGILRNTFSEVIHAYRVVSCLVCCGGGGTAQNLEHLQQSVYDRETTCTVIDSASTSFQQPSSSIPVQSPLFVGGESNNGKAKNETTPIAILHNPKASNDIESSLGQSRIFEKDDAPPVSTSSIYSKGSNSFSSFQLDSNVHDSEDNIFGQRKSKVKTSRVKPISTGASFFSAITSLSRAAAASLSSAGSVGSSELANGRSSALGRPESTTSTSNSSFKKKGLNDSVDGVFEVENRDENDFDFGGDGNNWNQQRKFSAELAEMVYRINSFSTEGWVSNSSASLRFDRGIENLSGSPTSPVQSGSSIDDARSLDSGTRREFINNIVGGNRALSPANSKQAKPFSRWFS